MKLQPFIYTVQKYKFEHLYSKERRRQLTSRRAEEKSTAHSTWRPEPGSSCFLLAAPRWRRGVDTSAGMCSGRAGLL